MKFIKYHLWFLLWLIIIFFESSFPADTYPKIEIWSADKIVHMGVYGILAALCYISLIHLEKFSFLARNALVMTIIICSLYGVTDEFHQYFIPNRDCEFWDWLADFAGIIIMLLLIKYYLSKKYDLFKSNEIPSF